MRKTIQLSAQTKNALSVPRAGQVTESALVALATRAGVAVISELCECTLRGGFGGGVGFTVGWRYPPPQACKYTYFCGVLACFGVVWRGLA